MFPIASRCIYSFQFSLLFNLILKIVILIHFENFHSTFFLGNDRMEHIFLSVFRFCTTKLIEWLRFMAGVKYTEIVSYCVIYRGQIGMDIVQRTRILWKLWKSGDRMSLLHQRLFNLDRLVIHHFSAHVLSPALLQAASDMSEVSLHTSIFRFCYIENFGYREISRSTSKCYSKSPSGTYW